MWRFRFLLLPFFAVMELVVLSASWVLAFVEPALARRFVDYWCIRLPDIRWYIGE